MEAYCRRRWGSSGWTNSMIRDGKSDGALFENWTFWPNTFQAHRLVLLADKAGKGNEAKEKMFEMTYERGLNVSSLETLCLAGDELELDGVQEYLSSDEGSNEVNERVKQAQSKGIDSVPCFVVGDKYILRGAQPPEAFQRTFERVLKES
uniref:DSBA-like thioredoxin domain-containing protein n=1 Tax=Pyramimonas obovata TaxID=1411642 RepID=A0A7S0WXS5_9CHLO|mmetsp:Transcript_9484/g.19640  ORF Transcript_9484/g.19640 Transcript_9484/m.19640 type:complete len:150 (+) Transcript_9484:226-675(+)